jgi:hypothetical protein
LNQALLVSYRLEARHDIRQARPPVSKSVSRKVTTWLRSVSVTESSCAVEAKEASDVDDNGNQRRLGCPRSPSLKLGSWRPGSALSRRRGCERRLFWFGLYRLWARCLSVMLLVKPATVLEWHRQGFRRYWRWCSRSRRPRRPTVDGAIRDLIRRMSSANPLWGAPRIHGEMLKLGIAVSQATVRRYTIRRPRFPSPTWRVSLRNQL